MERKDEQAQPGFAGFLAGTTELDEQRRRELAVHSLLIDRLPTFLVAVGMDGRTVAINKTMLTTLGYEQSEVIGQDYASMFIPERDRALLQRVFAELATKKSLTVNENRILTRDGRELLIEWHGQLIEVERGELFVGVGIDITERRRMEEALKRAEQKNAAHVERTPLAVIEWNADFEAVSWNPAATRIFGYTREEALGQSGLELIVPEAVRPFVQDTWSRLVGAGEAVTRTNENTTKEGKIITCTWYNTPLVDDEGRVIGVMSLAEDVTERARLEEELRERDREQAETIEQLSAPILDVWQGVLAMPIIGPIDEARAARMMETLLETIVRTRARFAILDVTGVSEIDRAVADALVKLAEAARLLGSQCLVSGIHPAMARVLTGLEVELGALMPFASLQAALRYALGKAK